MRSGTAWRWFLECDTLKSSLRSEHPSPALRPAADLLNQKRSLELQRLHDSKLLKSRSAGLDTRCPPPHRDHAWAHSSPGVIALPPGGIARAPEVGGASRDRTDDLLLAKQALSQLSYGPLGPGYRTSSPRAAGTVHAAACWWVWEDLNLRPHPYQGCALTN